MSFFIYGKTKCAICDQIIESRATGVQLPFIDPTTMPELLPFARRFVHRSCWVVWEHAPTYAAGAYNLMRHEVAQGIPLVRVFESDKLIVFWIEALQSYQLQDLDLLASVEIPQAACQEIIPLFCYTLSMDEFKSEWQSGSYSYQAKRVSTGVEFHIVQAEEIVAQFIVPVERQASWSTALEEIRTARHRIQRRR